VVFVVAASQAPDGLNAKQVDVPAVVAGYSGLAASGIGPVVVLRRALRWLGQAISRPGDRALADRWNAAAFSAQIGATHLVFIRKSRSFGRRGVSAWCEPYWSDMEPHSSWFEGRPAVRRGRWMQATGRIGRGRYGDERVLYVAEVLDVFSARARVVARRHQR
jgi:hypothetical protein